MPKIPNMNQMLKAAQSMAREMEEKMGNLEVEGNAGGGMVKAVMNGHKNLLSLTISPEVVDPDDIEMLQDLVISAVNDAQSRVDEELKGSLGGLPGMPGGFPFG
jgi:DNA-binding YbaB/EbfC family protein